MIYIRISNHTPHSKATRVFVEKKWIVNDHRKVKIVSADRRKEIWKVRRN